MVKWNKKGFTLVELMAVLAILAIIAVIAVPRFTGTIETAKQKVDKASAQIISRAAEQMYLDGDNDDVETYTGTRLFNVGYLKDVPEPQASELSEFIAVVNDDGICQGVYYGKDETDYNEGNNLLED